MHHEQIIVNKRNLENVLSNDIIIPVGTTSMRTLESVYWFGVKLLHDANATFEIPQDLPYQSLRDISKNQAIEKVIYYMEASRLSTLVGTTSIFIKPGYKFRVCNALITNFHQPASTLILLVAAFVGPAWREIYDQALKNDYRFLSYGDSSLLIP
jgi:S-adenosylmethionine:tRNA ribosyltransferase-isomerase